MGPSTLASWTLLIAQSLRRYGLDADAVFRSAQMAPAQLHQPTSRYPVAAVRRLWWVAAQASHDPCFGLEVGRSWHVTSFHALGYAALASATLREALARVARYCRVVTTGVTIGLVDAGRNTQVQLTNALLTESEPESLDAAVQAALAALTTLCREARGTALDPTCVLLMQEDKGCAARLDQFFRCPVRFGARSNALVFAERDLDAPLETSNPELVHLNEEAVTRYVARMQAPGVGERARAEIMASLAGGKISQAAVARRLHLSVRTMQRKLKSEGLSFRDVLDSARRQLADEYAKDRSVSKIETAYLLGFTEPRSLSRAMARWKARSAPVS